MIFFIFEVILCKDLLSVEFEIAHSWLYILELLAYINLGLWKLSKSLHVQTLCARSARISRQIKLFFPSPNRLFCFTKRH